MSKSMPAKFGGASSSGHFGVLAGKDVMMQEKRGKAPKSKNGSWAILPLKL
jgi:hypothetical protein